MKSHTVKTDKALLKGAVISFSVPFTVLLISFFFKELAPFGEKTLCSMDGFSQYFPMLRNMAQGVKQGEIFYSFNGALGFNLFSQGAYYTNSPLWLFVYFLPEALWFSAINILTAIKLSLASCFFYITAYLKHPKISEEKSVLCFSALSCAYGLSGYTLAFINQLMWTDVIVLLPLVAYGIEFLYKKNKPALYTVSLFLSIWSCFYLSYMVCIFSALYFLYIFFSEKENISSFLKKGTLFAAFSVLSAGLAAVVLIPVYKALSLTLASDLSFDGVLELKHTLTELMKNALPFREPSLEYGAPNLYCGIMTLLLVALSFISKKISLRQKLLSFSFLIFMLLTMSINLGEFIWHGFHYPNQLPGRQSFVYIFLVLSFAATYIAHTDIKKALTRVICVLLFIEICTNCVYQTGNHVWASKINSLCRYDAIMEQFTPLEKEEAFTRIEFADVKKNNCPQQYTYKGVTYYSSTMTADAYNFFQQMGQPRYAKNVSVYYLQSDIANSLFGISHILNLETATDKDGNEETTFTVEENKNALPLIFTCSDEILSFELYEHEAGENTQKALWQALTDEDEKSFSDQAQALISRGARITLFDTDKIKGTVTATKDSVLMTTIPCDGGWKIYIDGKESEIIKLADYFCGTLISEGEHEILLKYTVPGIKSGAAISLLSLAALLTVIIIKRKSAMLKRKAV